MGRHGLGPLREHQSAEWYLPSPEAGIRGVPDGIDLLEGERTLRSVFPFLGPGLAGGVHVRRAGSIDGGGLARWLWRSALTAEVDFVREEVVGVDLGSRGPCLRLGSGATVLADAVVLAPDARFAGLAARLGFGPELRLEVDPWLDLPELESFLPSDAPNLGLLDPERLEWSRTEIERLGADPRLALLVDQLPAGLALEVGGGPPSATWPIGIVERHPQWPPTVRPEFREALVRALVRQVPAAIHGRGGGRIGSLRARYAALAPDAQPVVGPIGPPGLVWIGGLGRNTPTLGLGVAELAGRIVLGEAVPDSVAGWRPDRLFRPAVPGRRARPADSR
jgi:hypothetical protein